MSLRSKLSEIGVRIVQFNKEKGKSESGINKIHNRSKTAVHNILGKKELYGTQKRCGREKEVIKHDNW